MKRETALRYVDEIQRRLKKCRGKFKTPDAGHKAYHVHEVWVFGSTVKGSGAPNDLDVLVRGSTVGKYRHPGGIVKGSPGFPYLSYGSRDRAMQQLRGGMRLVRLHEYEVDGGFVSPVVKIYPESRKASELCEKMSKMWAEAIERMRSGPEWSAGA